MAERRNTSGTVPFDRGELARLKQKTAEDVPLPKPHSRGTNVVPSQRPMPVPVPAPPESHARSRSETLADPLTTSVLAEVERTTADEDEIEITIEPAADKPHPHIKRRS